jgi:hypothetical protein
VPAGNFNLIYKDEDQNNCNYNKAMMGRFRRFINDLALKEIPLQGRKFTWSNQHESPTLVRQGSLHNGIGGPVSRLLAPKLGHQ